MEFITKDQRTTPPSTDSTGTSVSSVPRDSTAIKRLMEEVRCEEVTVSSAAAYNRQHNRHNR